MPSAWEWWAGYHGDVECEGVYTIGSFQSREAAIAAGLAEMPDADGNAFFHIVEARSSTAAKHEGADVVPFTHKRHHEIIGELSA